MWWQSDVEKNPHGIENLKLKFPILHIPRIDLFFFFLNSFLLPSRFDSSPSCSIWSSVLLPFHLFFFFFFLPNLVLSSGSDLILCSSSSSSRSSSIEIESYRLGFTFYKLESIRLEIYIAKKPPEQQVKLEFLRLKF